MILELSEPEEHFCFTCKSKIDFDPIRIIVFEKYGIQNVKYFHYFFPCWDPNYVVQCFSHHKIIQAGFSIDESLVTPKMIRSLKTNMDLWV